MAGRGRPPIGPKVSVRMPVEMRDVLEAEAEVRETTLAELVRSILYKHIVDTAP